METNPSKLQFNEFDVHFVYGFVTKPSEGFNEWFTGQIEQMRTDSSKAERSGWTPIYRLSSGADSVLQKSFGHRDKNMCLPGKKEPPGSYDIKIFPPVFWNKPADSDPATQGPQAALNAKVQFSYSLKGSGAGALTVTLRCCPDEGNPAFTTSEVLRVLLMAPRTEFGLPDPDSDGKFQWDRELATIDFDPDLKEHWSQYKKPDKNFSPVFQLFDIGMALFCKSIFEDSKESAKITWDEFVTGSSGDESIGTPIYEGSRYDPQIPYIYVVGKVPQDMYNESFSEQGLDYRDTRQNRKRYTKDIAAILNRWLVDRNIPYASYDFLEREGQAQDGAIISNYMNSLLFTAFSGIVTLTLQPSIQPETGNNESSQLPFDPAVHSILRFIKFSRMCWHQAMSINRALDNLIDEARDAGERDIPDLLKRLLDQRVKIAKYMQNPITYGWDATVGSAVARYLHDQVIGELEEATQRKLELVKQLIIDRADILQSKAVWRKIEEMTSDE